MKKYLLLILFILLVPIVKAESEMPLINRYVDGYAYYNDTLLKDTWAYDSTTNRYVKLGTDGNILYELDDPNKDPNVDHGKVSFKAIVPDNLKDIEIEVEISTIPYNYVFTLNKDNNFTIEENVVATNYSVSVFVRHTNQELETFYPVTINVYKDRTTNIDLDYSKYEVVENKKDKKAEKNKTILIVFASLLGLAFLIVLGMVIKARNI
jgi:hypothetical protein